jgi:hypothetical protein
MKIRKVNHIPSQTHSFLSLVTYVHISSSPIYRQTEGIIKATGKSLPDHPSYGHICKRINRLRVDIKKEDDWTADSDDEIIII